MPWLQVRVLHGVLRPISSIGRARTKYILFNRIHSSAVEHSTADRPAPCSNQGVSSLYGSLVQWYDSCFGCKRFQVRFLAEPLNFISFISQGLTRWRNWQRIGFQLRRLSVQITYGSFIQRYRRGILRGCSSNSVTEGDTYRQESLVIYSYQRYG